MKNPTKKWALKTIIGAGWAPFSVFAIHLISSRMFHAYLFFPPLDIPMHFLGGVAIALFFHRGVVYATECNLISNTDPIIYPIFVFSLVGTATVIWEFCEFLSDRFFETHAQLGLADTLSDMFFGILGGLCFIVFTITFAQQRAGANPATDEPRRSA